MNRKLKTRKDFGKETRRDGVWNNIAFIIFVLVFLATGHLDNLLVYVVSFSFGMFSAITMFNYITGYGFLSFLTLVRSSNILDTFEVLLDDTEVPQPTMSGGAYNKILEKKYGNTVGKIYFNFQFTKRSK